MLAAVPNSGTPLMVASFLHLVVGNALIGLLEAGLLHVVFRVSPWRAVPILIAANYGSMLVGIAVVELLGAGQTFGDDFVVAPAHVGWFLAGAVVAMWALTVALEWPLVRWALGAGCTWRRALWASLLLQTLSYAALVCWYSQFAEVSVLTRTTHVAAADFAPGLPLRVHYLATDATDGAHGAGEASAGGAAVWSVGFDGRPPVRVPRVAPGALIAARSAAVVAGEPSALDVLIAAGATALPTQDQAPRDVVDGWAVGTGIEPAEGLRARHVATGVESRFALATPFMTWFARQPTALSDGIVVYELGPHIVALELGTRRLAVLAQGASPIVVLPR